MLLWYSLNTLKVSFYENMCISCIKIENMCIINLESLRPNTSPDPLSFKFVLDRSFKFLRFQIGPLSFEFVSDRSFKFIRFQIGPLSFEFV